MNYADYKNYDFLNGEGLRNSLFVSGCLHHCEKCFNAVAWNFNYGNPYTQETEDMIINDLNVENINVQGLSLLGGEPFEHTEQLTKLLKRVRTECKGKDVWCWSGYTFEEILSVENKRELLQYIDVLVDGKFILSKRDLKLKFRGSSNQRIVDVQLSLRENKLILWKDGEY